MMSEKVRFLEEAQACLAPRIEEMNVQLQDRRWNMNLRNRLVIEFTDMEGRLMAQGYSRARVGYPVRFEIYAEDGQVGICDYTSEGAEQKAWPMPTAGNWTEIMTAVTERMGLVFTGVNSHPWSGYFDGPRYVDLETPIAGMTAAPAS